MSSENKIDCSNSVNGNADDNKTIKSRLWIVGGGIGLLVLSAIAAWVVFSENHEDKANVCIAAEDPDKVAAKKAFEKANVELSRGNVSRARILLLNAVNHDPADFGYLEAYYKTLPQEPTLEEIDNMLKTFKTLSCRAGVDVVEKLFPIMSSLENERAKLVPDTKFSTGADSEEIKRALNIVQENVTAEDPDKVAAKKAFEKANVELSLGNVSRARILLLNALNHDPADFGYLEAYRNTFPQNPTLEEIESMTAVFQAACYNIHADAAEKLFAMCDDLEDLRIELIEKEFVEISAENDEELVEEKTENPVPEAIVFVRDAGEFVKKTEEHLKDVPEKSKNPREYSRKIAMIQTNLQLAENAILQAWNAGFEPSMLSDDVADPVVLTERIEQLNEEFRQVCSRESAEIVNKLLDEILSEKLPTVDNIDIIPEESANNGALTKMRERILEKKQKAEREFAKISSEKLQLALLERFHPAKKDSISPEKLLSEIEVLRRSAYNLWAVKKIDAAHKSDSKQDQYYALREIDQALLTPAISALFATVYSNEFGSDVDFQIEIAKTEKIGLDRF